MTKRRRRHSTARKREIVEAYLNGEALHALSMKFAALAIDRQRRETPLDLPGAHVATLRLRLEASLTRRAASQRITKDTETPKRLAADLRLIS